MTAPKIVGQSGADPSAPLPPPLYKGRGGAGECENDGTTTKVRLTS